MDKFRGFHFILNIFRSRPITLLVIGSGVTANKTDEGFQDPNPQLTGREPLTVRNFQRTPLGAEFGLLGPVRSLLGDHLYAPSETIRPAANQCTRWASFMLFRDSFLSISS